jgi:methylated-DNA-[protein]-cysteine S-methyltransferase
MREYKTQTKELILTTTFSTPIGEMFAAASKKGIVILALFTPFNIEAKIQILKNTLDAEVIPGNCEIFEALRTQLEEYFKKQRTTFKIPLQLVGSAFQVKCWKELLKIPYGKTVDYKIIAKNINEEKAIQEVNSATAQNMIALLIPSHRAVSNDNMIENYNGGIEKKEFLLKLEKNDK